MAPHSASLRIVVPPRGVFVNVRPNKRLLPEHSCFAAVKVRFHVGGVAAVTAMLRNVENRTALLGVVALGVTTYCTLATTKA